MFHRVTMLQMAARGQGVHQPVPQRPSCAACVGRRRRRRIHGEDLPEEQSLEEDAPPAEDVFVVRRQRLRVVAFLQFVLDPPAPLFFFPTFLVMEEAAGSAVLNGRPIILGEGGGGEAEEVADHAWI